ncbi:hypothetical protein AMELA_G00060640, partial [Ameiurus melas]
RINFRVVDYFPIAARLFYSSVRYTNGAHEPVLEALRVSTGGSGEVKISPEVTSLTATGPETKKKKTEKRKRERIIAASPPKGGIKMSDNISKEVVGVFDGLVKA